MGFSWPEIFLLGASGHTERFFTQVLSHNPISLAFANACNACRCFYLVIVQQTNAGIEASSTQVRLVCFFLGDGGLTLYDLEESCGFLCFLDAGRGRRLRYAA